MTDECKYDDYNYVRENDTVQTHAPTSIKSSVKLLEAGGRYHWNLCAFSSLVIFCLVVVVVPLPGLVKRPSGSRSPLTQVHRFTGSPGYYVGPPPPGPSPLGLSLLSAPLVTAPSPLPRPPQDPPRPSPLPKPLMGQLVPVTFEEAAGALGA
ncbi:hypothetical protein B0H15DRAFT_807739 [Mycena belliarum]|uniref:Uncharacterized protein n=1 Tax=Mycena belliarum TaxID=1033014 RepID=A0AAD6XHG2_9AGAR|nr:hypothetical protein B0H15DRAFT_807739 [Mycena belliae]